MIINAIKTSNSKISFRQLDEDDKKVVAGTAGVGGAAVAAKGASSVAVTKGVETVAKGADTMKKTAKYTKEAQKLVGGFSEKAGAIKGKIIDSFETVGKSKFFKPLAGLAKNKYVRMFAGALGSILAVFVTITEFSKMINVIGTQGAKHEPKFAD